jgi:hypothetical protein
VNHITPGACSQAARFTRLCKQGLLLCQGDSLYPAIDWCLTLAALADFVLSLMKGKHLITYDQIKNPFT